MKPMGLRPTTVILILVACARPVPRSSGPSRQSGTPAPAPVAAPPRYVIPTCPLRYEVSTVEHSTMEGGETGGVELRTFIVANAVPHGSRLDLEGAVTARPTMGTGKFRSFAVPDMSYAPVALETNGTQWIERDGPTMLFAGMGTQGGLAWLLPNLPESGAPGSTVAWAIPTPDPTAICTTEVARGKHDGLDETMCHASKEPRPHEQPKAFEAQVKVERWSAEGGSRAAVLSMTGTQTFDTADGGTLGDAGALDARIRGRAEYKGEYVVIESGRLLRATLEKDVHAEMVTTIRNTQDVQKHVQHMRMDAHLVAACDGPTESSLGVPLSREERAIAAWGETSLALVKGERDNVLAGLGAELRRKHGDGNLWKALLSYKTTRGDRAVPLPLFVGDEDVKSEADVVHVTARGTTPRATEANTVTGVKCDIALREDTGRFLVVNLRCDLEIEGSNLLEISPVRITLTTGWPASKRR
jgi:hypothetical protein